MIRGYFDGPPGRRRPFVTATLTIPALTLAGEVHFLVDTGADSTLLAPRDATVLGIDPSRLAPGPPGVGVGGRTPTTSADAFITLDGLTLVTTIRLLVPTSTRQHQALASIPSLLGRDVLRRFALFVEERTDPVLLLTADEADALELA